MINKPTKNLIAVVFLAAVMARAQAPAGPNRPASVPDDYVITPFGYFHPSCVLQLKKGEMLLDGGRSIQRTGGTIEYLASCTYPRFTAAGEIINAQPPSIGHSWIEAGDATTSASYGELTASWVVPPGPSSNDNQILYFFPGLEDTHHVVSILQPVLGWNSDFSASWSLASWNCCPNGITVESQPLHVKSGDKIKGTMKDTCKAGTLSCSKWDVTSTDVSTGHSTALHQTPSEGQTFNWAFSGAVEVYNIARCSDYPSNGAITFSGVAVYDRNFHRISSPGWAFANFASGLSPQCGYTGQVSATQVKLDY